MPLLALAGIVAAILSVVAGDNPRSGVVPVTPGTHPPFAEFVAGSGIVEAGTENLSIATEVEGVVAKVFVNAGDEVEAGDPLFRIDDRAARADVEVRRAAVRVAEAGRDEAKYEFELVGSLAKSGNVSDEEFAKRRFAVRKSAEELTLAEAQLNAAETMLALMTVHAPVGGTILQLKIHPGEYVPAGAGPVEQQPLLLMGGTHPLHVRVDVDEYDAWRVREGSRAVGCLRGNPDVETPLKFVRIEPFVVPKRSLSGSSTERVDTRVLQVIFSFERGALPIRTGQQMDVFIEATAPAGGTDAPGGTGRHS